MTLYILATENKKKKKSPLKMAAVFLEVALFSVLFDNIYALFGHGVRSGAMSFMFLYPLLGGGVVYLLLGLFIPGVTGKRGYRAFYHLYNFGIALLTVKSLLQGIFEMAGTNSNYLIFYTVFGWLFAAAGIITLLAVFTVKKKE
ncbi:MAG: hypothetical protein ACK5JF_02050 [Oscillospiraceae bacterium]